MVQTAPRSSAVSQLLQFLPRLLVGQLALFRRLFSQTVGLRDSLPVLQAALVKELTSSCRAFASRAILASWASFSCSTRKKLASRLIPFCLPCRLRILRAFRGIRGFFLLLLQLHFQICDRACHVASFFYYFRTLSSEVIAEAAAVSASQASASLDVQA